MLLWEPAAVSVVSQPTDRRADAKAARRQCHRRRYPVSSAHPSGGIRPSTLARRRGIRDDQSTVIPSPNCRLCAGAGCAVIDPLLACQSAGSTMFAITSTGFSSGPRTPISMSNLLRKTRTNFKAIPPPQQRCRADSARRSPHARQVFRGAGYPYSCVRCVFVRSRRL